MSVIEIRTGTRRDPILSQVMKYVQQGWLNYNSDEALKPYFSRKVELSVQDGCLLKKNRKSPLEAPLQPWQWPHKPWVLLHLDYAGPFLGQMFLIVIDAHSKWIEAFPMNTSTSSATIEKLRITFATHGLPGVVVTDNGSNFVSREFEDFIKQNPASNERAERAVQTFKEGMRKMNGGSVETRVSQFLARYRIIPQTSTGVSPAELLLGRKLRSRLDLVYPEIGRKVRQSQASQKLAHDWHAKERTMQEGEAVYASNFRSGPKWMPGVLKQSTCPTSFAVQLEDERLLRRHQDKPYTVVERHPRTYCQSRGSPTADS